MKVAILLYDGVTALDAIGPYETLALLPDVQIQFVAKEKGPKKTDNGFLQLTADYAFADVTSADVLVVPGSANSTRIQMEDDATLNWLREIHSTTKWTTSVCSGSLILAGAGLLKGLKATTHWFALDMLKMFGAEPVQERMVQQGKVVTAAGVSAGLDMALFLAAEIAGAEVAKSIQLVMEYDPAPPFDSGSIGKASPEVVNAARDCMARLTTRGPNLRASAVRS
ncbi:MAG TPA: DJ-1/PfpI family protein [Pyrinomonadaceae bacterium]|nr:DJ-1/PfpI family protein [Pyrinomonadaceae bacterium]